MIDAERLHSKVGYGDAIELPSPHRTFNWDIGDHPSLYLTAMQLLHVITDIKMRGAGDMGVIERQVQHRLAFAVTDSLLDRLGMHW